MQFSFKTIKEKCQKLFPPPSPEEDRSVEDDTAQPEEQAKVDSVSDAYSTWLCDLWQILRKQTYHQIKVEDLEAFGISYEKFELDTGVDAPLLPPDENTFFSPNFAKVKNLQPDPDQWGFEDIMDFLGEWPEPSNSPFYKEVKRDNAESLCSALYVAFASLEWKGYEKKESICLEDQTNWRHAYVAQTPFGYRFLDSMYANHFTFIDSDFDEAFDVNKWRVSGFWHNRGCDSRPQDVWLAKGKPHIMATIAHGYPSDNGSLLLGEIQAIIALMIVRLVNNSVPEHDIVPVLLYSYTGDKHGRVLQAYMNHKNLVIRSSKFYDFSTKHDAHLKLLLQYMVSDLVGTTMTLETPDLKSIDTSEDSDSGFGSAWRRLTMHSPIIFEISWNTFNQMTNRHLISTFFFLFLSLMYLAFYKMSMQ